MQSDQSDRSDRSDSWRRGLPGIVAVAATYVFFLLYAQFGFLDLLRARLAAGEVQAAMAAMGVAGLLASLGAAAAQRRLAPKSALRIAFLGCAAVAPASLAADGRALLPAAALIGAFTALLTVTLATHLRALIPGPRFGLGVGLGTGLAYLVCNLPPLFAGSPAVRAAAAVVACLAGAAAVRGVGQPSPRAVARPALARRDSRGLGFATIVLSFLALIWLDSAAFAVIQENLALKGLTWGGGHQLLALGATHFLAAVAAGWLIDRGFFRSLLLVTFALFAAAFTALEHRAGALFVAGPVYAVGISLYSTALVTYPAYRPDGEGLVPRRWRAGLLFGVAGWLGSALGVGMAQDLHTVPPLFLVLAGALLLAARAARQDLARAHAVTLAGAALGVAFYAAGAAPPAAGTAVERGRRVYVQEGCINCHSQYVRPRSADVELFGPHRAIDRRETPPLPGNRRQGPDLTNAGSRRSAAWHRLHLRDPRALVPGSRMPSYAHLFAAGDPRGDDLVAYLASLGEGAADDWYQITLAFPRGELPAGSAARGRELFGDYCAACHGAQGRGDGPLAAAVYRPAMNLRKEHFWAISWGPGAEPEERALARVVKYGVPGTSMPGHEYLSDGQVADVVAYVEALRRETVVAETVVAGAGDLR